MTHGGARKGAGRKRGIANKKKQTAIDAAQEAAQRVLAEMPDVFEGDSYALLSTVCKNNQLPLTMRIDAAKIAIGYERPGLSQVAMTTRSLDQLSDDEFFRMWDGLQAVLAQSGRPLLIDDGAVDRAGGEESGDAVPPGTKT